MINLVDILGYLNIELKMYYVGIRNVIFLVLRVRNVNIWVIVDGIGGIMMMIMIMDFRLSYLG